METLKCFKCEEDKPVSEFYVRRCKGVLVGHQSWCKPCFNDYQKKKAALRIPVINSKMVRASRIKRAKKHNLINKYGVDVADIMLNDGSIDVDVFKELNGY